MGHKSRLTLLFPLNTLKRSQFCLFCSHLMTDTVMLTYASLLVLNALYINCIFFFSTNVSVHCAPKQDKANFVPLQKEIWDKAFLGFLTKTLSNLLLFYHMTPLYVFGMDFDRFQRCLVSGLSQQTFPICPTQRPTKQL